MSFCFVDQEVWHRAAKMTSLMAWVVVEIVGVRVMVRARVMIRDNGWDGDGGGNGEGGGHGVMVAMVVVKV